MPLDREKLHKLYSALQQGGYGQSYDEFEKGFTGDNHYGNRKKVYDLLTEHGADIGSSYGEFMKKMYTSKGASRPQSRRQPSGRPVGSQPSGKPWKPHFDMDFGGLSPGLVPTARYDDGQHVDGKYDPIEAGRRRWTASQAANPSVRRQASQGNPHARRAVGEGNGTNLETIGEEALARQKNTGEKPLEQVATDASLRTDPVKAGKRWQQRMDELEYFNATGRELANPLEIGTDITDSGKVTGNPLYAPTVARDEQGNMVVGDDGQPLVGSTGDEERTGAYRQTLVARQKPTIDEKIKKAEAEEARLTELLNRRGKELDSENLGFSWRDMPRGGGALVHTINSVDVNGRFTDTEYMQLYAALKKNEDRLRDLRAARDERTGTFLGGLMRGMNDYVFDPSNWDGGYRDMLTEAARMRSKGGFSTTGRERQSERLLQENESGAEEAAQELENVVGNGYRWGSIAGRSLPFMMQFMAGNAMGMTKGLTRAGEGIGAALARKIAMKQGSKNILRGMGRSVLKNTGVALGDLSASMALSGTLQAPATLSDIADRYVGELKYDPSSGEYKYEDGKSLGRSIYEGVANSTIENYTEMLGEHIHLGKFASSALTKMGLGRVSDWFTKVGKTDFMKGVNKYLEKGGFNGYPQEVLEEEIGIPLHAIFDGGEQIYNPLDPEQRGKWKRQQLDIVGGMLFSMAGMGGASLIAESGHRAGMARLYHQDQRKLDRADRTASFRLTSDKWAPIKEQIDNTTNKDFGRVMQGVLGSDDLSEQEKEAVWDYAQKLVTMRGHNMGQEAAVRNGMADKETNASNESYTEGYNTVDATEMNDARNRLVSAQQALDTIFGENTDARQILDARNEDGTPYFTANDRRKAQDVVNAQQEYEGMLQRVRDDMDDEVQQTSLLYDQRTNPQTGMIQQATLKEQTPDGKDRKVYVTSGNIVMMDDGQTVDRQKSDMSVVIVDDEGKVQMVDPEKISSLDAPVNGEEAKQQAIAAIQAQRQREAQDKIDGKVQLTPNATYDILDDEGQQGKVTLVPNAETGAVQNPDGTVNVSIDGQPGTMTVDDLQRWVDNANMLRTTQAQAEQAEEAEAQPTQPVQQEPHQWEVDDTFTVTDDEGQPVRGQVVGIDADGIQIRTETSLNGKKVQVVAPEQLEKNVTQINGEERYEQPETNDNEISPKPIGNSVFGNVYDQFKGKVKEAVNFLIKAKDGIAKGVLHRDGVGDVDMIWGDDKRGLRHIIMRHVVEQSDFDSVDDLVNAIEEVVTNGKADMYNDHVVFNHDGTRVVAAKTGDGQYVLTAYDTTRTKGEKKRAEADATRLYQDIFGTGDGNLVPQSSGSGAKLGNNSESVVDNSEKVSALSKIPSEQVDDGKGNVRTVHNWEQAEPGDTYDALTEIYHGNADRVKKGVQNRIGAIDKDIKKVQKQMDAIDNSDDFDAVAAQAEQYDQLQAQKEQLEVQKKYWQGVQRVPTTRRMEQDRRTAEEKAAADAARKQAEAEAAEKARQERERVNGVPDVINDTPSDARKRGFRNVNGMVVERQQPVDGVTGREARVKFSSSDTAKGTVKVIEAEQLQPSHVSGQRNPNFFIDEAQPKDRTDAVSSMAAAKIASNLNPEEITGDGSAYQFSSPTVNSRGEVIQGNNRSDALKLMWSSPAFKPAQDTYKQYIADHAEDFGFTAEDVQKIQQMQHPVMVNQLDVDDDEAIRLGQMKASDNESGGIERIDPVTTSQKLGSKVSNFANVLLSSPDEDASLNDVLMQNGAKAVKWLSTQGVVSDTAAQSAFDRKGNLTPEARMDLQNILKQSLFQGGVSDLPAMFDRLPAKAQKAILNTFMRDFDSAESERILPEIQKAIEAWYGCANANEAFAKASNYKGAKAAMHDWTLQTNLLDDNMPSDKFSNFAMELACRLQGCSMRETQQNLGDFFDLVQGKSQGDLFGGTTAGEQADRQEAIRRIFNIDYQPINNNVNGENGSNAVAEHSGESREGRRGSTGNGADRERTTSEGRQDAGGGGTVLLESERRGQGDLQDTSGRQQHSLEEEGEVDEKGNPFVLSTNGTTTFGEITDDTGLDEAPIKLSRGEVDDDGNGYGLAHIEARHGGQIRKAGFPSVQDFVEHVAQNYDKDDIKVGKKRLNGNPTFIIQVQDTHSNLLYIELSSDGSYWNVNSGGIFRKGYSEKKKNVESNAELSTSPSAPENKPFAETDNQEGSMSADAHSGNQRPSAAKLSNKPEKTAKKQEKVDEKPFKVEHHKGGDVALYKVTSEKDGVTYTRIRGVRNGEEVGVARAYFPIPDGYHISSDSELDDDVEVLGVHEMREKDGRISATLECRIKGETGFFESDVKLEKDSPNSNDNQNTDSQGNPIDKDGKLIKESVSSVDEITDEDFTNPTRTVELPKLPENVDKAIGANGKPVIIKKNIFEKNAEAHQFEPSESRRILKEALYNTDLVGQTQPSKRPNHWVAIKIDEESPITVLEVNENKDNVEVVGWYRLDDRNLGRIQRQAEREGGELLILTPKGAAASLSTLPRSSSSERKGKQSSSKKQGKSEKKNEGQPQRTEHSAPKREVSDEEFDDIMSQLGDIFGEEGSIVDFFSDEWDNVPKLDLGVEEGEVVSLDKVKELFEGFNADKGIGALAVRIFNVADRLDLDIRFEGDEFFKFGQQGKFRSDGTVHYRMGYFAHGGVSAQEKAHVLLHELIHSVTMYAMYDYRHGGKHLTPEMKAACKTIYDVYDQIKDDPLFEGEYGRTDAREMIAEAWSKASFREKLKQKNLWTRLVDAIKEVLGIATDGYQHTTAYDELSNALDTLLEGFDAEAYESYLTPKVDDEAAMGSRVNKRMADVGQKLQGVSMTDEQRKVADVFTGKSNRETLSIVNRGRAKTVVHFQTGDERHFGTKHSLFGHYGTRKGTIEAEDILRVPQVLEEGERTNRSDGRGFVYSLSADGVTYKVVTEGSGGNERFQDYYTNKKIRSASEMANTADTQPSARSSEPDKALASPSGPNGEHAQSAQATTNADAKVGNNSESANNFDDFFASYKELTPEQKAKVQVLGTRAAMAMIERGTTSFEDFAKAMIRRLGDNIRPFLKSFYNGARDFPGFEDYALTPYEDVRKFNVATIGKEGEEVKPSILETAEQVSNESQVERKASQEMEMHEVDVMGLMADLSRGRTTSLNEHFTDNDTDADIKAAHDYLSKQLGVTVLQKADLQITDTNDEPTTPDEAEEGDVMYREVDDEEAARLDAEPTIKVYRAMQEHDGKLYPPMSGRVREEYTTKNGKKRNRWKWREPTELGKWEQSEEHPERANDDGTFTLDKGNGSTIDAAYNPYIHTSRSPINDQFSSAWNRPELVTVEVEVPASELSSGYKAEKAKDAVGEVQWKSGPVSSELAKQDNPRLVILSRWDKPVRIVPVEEVADEYAMRLAGTGIAVPFNTVPPALRDALAARGVEIGEPEKGNAGTASRPSYEEWMQGRTREREGNGAYTDEELSYINDPVAKLLGHSHRTKAQQKAFADRERKSMESAVRNLAEKLHLDNVEIVTEPMTITDRGGKVHRPKGFYNRANGKITIVIPSHANVEDALQTLLHEAVAHYGLRQLFGTHFDTFLDNVYAAADTDVRRRITELALRKYGGDFHTATEEYLASLAEDTDFENMPHGFWQKIKGFFLELLHSIGFDGFDAQAKRFDLELSDNELRYILWRSYENLKEPGRYRSILGEAEDVAKQAELQVGNYAKADTERQRTGQAAEGVAEEHGGYVSYSSSEVKAYPQRVHQWLSKENLDKARGKETDEIFKMFGNEPQPIAYIPEEYLYTLGDGITDNRIYSGMGYFIDHALNHHPSIDAEKYDYMQEVLSHPDDVKETNDGIAFIKKIDRWNAVIVNVEKTADGRIIWHKSFLDQKNQMYKNKPSLLKKKSPADATPSINPTETAVGSKRNVSTLDDSAAKLENNSETSANNSEKVSEPRVWGKKDLLSKAEQVTEGIDPDLLFRDTIEDDDDTARVAYDKMADAATSQVREAWQDSMIAVRNLQRAVLKQRGEKLEDFEDAYEEENRSHGRGQDLADYFRDNLYKPLYKAVSALAKSAKVSVGDVTQYMMAKHGLERNDVFAGRDAQAAWDKYQEKQKERFAEYQKAHPGGNKTIADFMEKGYDDFYNQYREKDYSGLTELTGTDNVQDAEAEARKIVSGMEGKADTADLWDKVNAATKWTLRNAFNNGIISKDNYEHVRDMFKWYIPLRGWSDDTAEDIYDYVGASNNGTAFSPTIHKAHGRKTEADNPIAYIASMGISSITQGMRNKYKQSFLGFVENHPTNLVTVSEMWYRNYGTEQDPDWREDVPYIPEDATAEQIAAIVAKHEKDMEALKAQGLATKERGRLHLSVPIRKGQAMEHHVEVMVNGKKYVLYINGNPRAAQALNGTRSHRASDHGVTSMLDHIAESFESMDNWIGRRLASLTRLLSRGQQQMGANFTSRNPAFMLGNAFRDVDMALAVTAVKESIPYMHRFRWTLVQLGGPTRMFHLKHWYEKYRAKGGDGSGLTGFKRWYWEFNTGGGRTGFTGLKDIEDYKKELRRDYEDAQRSPLNVRKLWHSLGDALEYANSCVEDMTRFATFVASRKSGRNVRRSVTDAKNITLNFNRKGSGEMGNQAFREMQIFVNPAIQSAQVVASLATHHPVRFSLYTAMRVLIGAGTPMATALLWSVFGGGDGDDGDDWNAVEEYWNLPSWQRRSNFVCWIPGTRKFLMIPLAQEFRVANGFGEAIASSMSGHGTDNPIVEALTEASGLLPLDFTGNGNNPLITLAPTIAQPLLQIGFNTDFTGRPIYKASEWNKYEPAWQKAYIGTPRELIAASEKINGLTGGNAHKQGWWEQTAVGSMANNPAVVDHALKGYFGGTYSMLAQFGGLAFKAWNGESPDLREIPMANRLVTAPREREQNGKTKMPDWYYDMAEDSKRYQNEWSGYRKDWLAKKPGAKERVDEMMNSDEFKKQMQVNAIINAVNQIRAAQPTVEDPQTEDEAKSKQELAEGLQHCIEMLEKIRQTGKALPDDEM